VTNKPSKTGGKTATMEARHLRAIIRNGGPRIAFQPIVNLWTGTTVGYEALSRFPDHGPDEWFKAAAIHGLGVDLELAAIGNAATEYARLGLDGYLSLNASPELLATTDLTHYLDGMSHGRVQIEITETEPVHEYGPLLRALTRIRRAHGIALAVDDVGAGYAAMRHVIYLYPDVLKLDRDLVRGLHYVSETARRAVLSAYAHLANRLQLELVAEGIESHDEVVALRALGVNYGQGFHFAAALPADELLHRENAPHNP
jgi:EAL domain-containing protein (putative c-di-GMP-specific phosphodiesterase class I)